MRKVEYAHILESNSIVFFGLFMTLVNNLERCGRKIRWLVVNCKFSIFIWFSRKYIMQKKIVAINMCSFSVLLFLSDNLQKQMSEIFIVFCFLSLFSCKMNPYLKRGVQKLALSAPISNLLLWNNTKYKAYILLLLKLLYFRLLPY